MSEVTVAVLPDQAVLSLLRRFPVEVIETVIKQSLAELRTMAETTGLVEEGAPFGVFHAPVTQDSDGPLEIVLPVNDLVATPGDVRSYRLPGGHFALRRLVGPQTHFPAILGFYTRSAPGSTTRDTPPWVRLGRSGTTAHKTPGPSS